MSQTAKRLIERLAKQKRRRALALRRFHMSTRLASSAAQNAQERHENIEERNEQAQCGGYFVAF